MQIFIKLLSNKTILLNVNSFENIKNIKNKIEIKEGIPSNLIRLNYKKELNNNKTLFDYKIEEMSTLYLYLSLKSNI